MGDNVSGRKLGKLILAAAAFALTATSGAMLLEGPAMAAKAKAKAKPAASPGKTLFVEWSCGSCHVLKDAGGTGPVGPKLDGTKLTKAFVVGRITNGQGAMPGFKGQLTTKEIDTLATYIAAQSNK